MGTLCTVAGARGQEGHLAVALSSNSASIMSIIWASGGGNAAKKCDVGKGQQS